MGELKSLLLLYVFKMSRLKLHEIETRFAKYDTTAIRRTLDAMYLFDNFIDIEETTDKINSIISITDEGRVQATNLQVRSYLTGREVWKERFFGFVSGILISVISGIILWLVTG